MLMTLMLILAWPQEASSSEMTLDKLLAGYRENAQHLQKYRVVFTRKIELNDGFKLYHSNLANLYQVELQRTHDEKKAERLRGNIGFHTNWLNAYEKWKLQFFHFDYRTDGKNYLLISPGRFQGVNEEKTTWPFPDISVTQQSLTEEYADYGVLSYRPNVERPFLLWSGLFNNKFNATKSNSLLMTGSSACFPPLTRGLQTGQGTRVPLDEVANAKPAESMMHLKKDRSGLVTVTFYGKDQNVILITQNEKEYQGRIRLRGETQATFDTSKGYLPVNIRMASRMYLDDKAVEGRNGELMASVLEIKTSKIEKIGKTYYPFEIIEREYVVDTQAAQSITIKQLVTTNKELKPLFLKSTTTWTIHRLQVTDNDIPSFELPEGTLVVDTTLGKPAMPKLQGP